MNKEVFVVLVHPGQLAEEIPSPIDGQLGSGVELVSRPVDSPQSHRIEAVGIDQCRLVMVAEDGQGGLADHQFEALVRVGAIADDIPKADDIIDTLSRNILKHGLEGFQIAVDVADQSLPHEFPFEKKNIFLGQV